jgi:hypothetical protein
MVEACRKKLEHVFGDASFIIDGGVRSNSTNAMIMTFTDQKAILTWKVSFSVGVQLMMVHWNEVLTEEFDINHDDIDDPPQQLTAQDGRVKLVGTPCYLRWDASDKRAIDAAFFGHYNQDADAMFGRTTVHVLGDEDVEEPLWKNYEYDERPWEKYCDLKTVRGWDFKAGTVLEFEMWLPLKDVAKSVWIDRETIGRQLEATGISRVAGDIMYSLIISKMPVDVDILTDAEYNWRMMA